MATEYICFSCGNHFAIGQLDINNVENNNCPKCGGTNILKLNAQSLYSLFSSGG